MVRILLIDDDADFSDLMSAYLEGRGHRVHWADGPEAGLELLAGKEQDPFDVLLLDNLMPRMHGLEFLEELRRRDVQLPVLLLTSHSTADVAIRAAKLGAFKYLIKPDDFEGETGRLLPLINEAAEVARQAREPALLPTEQDPKRQDVLLGKSEPMCEVYEQIGAAARQQDPVLISGEMGTGKELVARALFHHSDRNGKPLLKINCAADEESRLEDELFGYEANAYPGAGRGCPGLLEQADGGAVLLDHFTFLSRATQAKLIRLIQEGVFLRRGRGARPVAADVRILACTTESLSAALADGRVDPELCFLLRRTSIHLPPLRERGEDVGLLAEHFLVRTAAVERRPVRSFHAAARDRLRRHDWPGNVRELQGVVRQAVLSCRGIEIGPAEVKLESRTSAEETSVHSVNASRREDASEKRLPPSREKAYQLFCWALQQDPRLADRTDAEVFGWLQQDLRVEGEGLPREEKTFERYLRDARAYYHDHKNTPRLNRCAGRSIVRLNQI